MITFLWFIFWILAVIGGAGWIGLLFVGPIEIKRTALTQFLDLVIDLGLIYWIIYLLGHR